MNGICLRCVSRLRPGSKLLGSLKPMRPVSTIDCWRPTVPKHQFGTIRVRSTLKCIPHYCPPHGSPGSATRSTTAASNPSVANRSTRQNSPDYHLPNGHDANGSRAFTTMKQPHSRQVCVGLNRRSQPRQIFRRSAADLVAESGLVLESTAAPVHSSDTHCRLLGTESAESRALQRNPKTMTGMAVAR